MESNGSDTSKQTFPVYTIGIQGNDTGELKGAIAQYGINCVVDVCGGDEPVQEALNGGNVINMSFRHIFGNIPITVRDRWGRVVYERAIADESISRGLHRLINGIEKGYCILIVHSGRAIEHTISYTLIGRFLTQHHYTVLHIPSPFQSGVWLTQRDVYEKERAKAQHKRDKQLQSIALGNMGEDLAIQYLLKHNYIILHRNWSIHKGGELDIVAYKDGVIHFVEVKTRSNERYAPHEAIDDNKLHHLNVVISEYRSMYKIARTPYTLDSIAIVCKSPTSYTLTYVQNIGAFATEVDRIEVNDV